MQTAILIVIFFITSGISIVTGSTSLLTVPALFHFDVAPRTAIATNMFALLFMSVGGSLPFFRSNEIDRTRIGSLILLTLVGSIIGAFLLVVPSGSVPFVVSTAMIGVAVFSLIYRQTGVQQTILPPTKAAEITGYGLTLVLGIYGGFFSGGYVTALTAVFVVLFRMTFLQAIATTKVVNVFSSGISTSIFMWHGLVDYQLGVVLGVAMFAGALCGSRFAIRLGNEWLRRIYLTAVWILGLKSLFFDILAKNYTGCGRHEPAASLTE